MSLLGLQTMGLMPHTRAGQLGGQEVAFKARPARLNPEVQRQGSSGGDDLPPVLLV